MAGKESQRALTLADATAAAHRRARDLRERSDAEPARLLEEAAESAGEIAEHLAGIIERLAEAAAAGRPIDGQVRAFRAAAETTIAASRMPPPGGDSDVLPLRRAAGARVRTISAVLAAFDLVDAGRERSAVADYLRSRHPDLDDAVLDAVLVLAYDR